MTRNLRAIVRALKRARRRVPWCDRKVKGTYREVVFASGTAAASGGFTSRTFDTDYPGAFIELTFGSGAVVDSGYRLVSEPVEYLIKGTLR